MDHMSRLIYNHMIEGITSAEHLAAKHAYKRVAKAYGITAKFYHADNLIFNDANHKGSCIKSSQKLTLCGIGDHH